MSTEVDPIFERIRDALGVVRCLYLAAEGMRGRGALKRAGGELGRALHLANSRRRDKQLGAALATAVRAIENAARAAPWGAPALMGACRSLAKIDPTLHRYEDGETRDRPMLVAGDDVAPNLRTPAPPRAVE